MRFLEKLERGAFPVALEITPPQTPLPGVLRRRARLVGERADVVNVIQRADRWSSLDASIALRKQGIEPVWHVVSRGRTRTAVAADAARAREAEVRLVLCLRGDHAAEDLPETPRIREVVALLREAMPDASIGVTANPYGPRERVLANLLPKLEAGAGLVQTHLVFGLEALRPVAESVRERSPATKIVPMAMPLVDLASAERIASRLALPLPDGLLDALRRGDAEAGWERFTETLVSLRESPLADGVAIMTPTMDVEPGFASRIECALAAALA